MTKHNTASTASTTLLSGTEPLHAEPAANDVVSTPRTRITPVVLHSVDATVLAYPARLLPMLPVATTLRLWVPRAGQMVAVSTSPSRMESLRDFGQIVFSGEEWSALVVGVESERVGPDDLQLFCDAKIDDPDFTLTEDLALSGASADVPQNQSLREVLRRMGAEIVSLTCEEDEMADTAQYAIAS